MRLRRYSTHLFVAALFAASFVLAEQKGWWQKILPGKMPQVLSDTPSKPLVEPHPDALNLQSSFAQVAEAVKPAVVNISAVHIQKVSQGEPHEFFFGDPNEFFYRFFGEEPPQQRRQQRPPREFRQEGTGSGVIIDPDGYILTNNHVVQGADQLSVTMSDGKTFKGSVVGTDPRTDLAVIRIKGSNPFPFAPLGDSGIIRIGDWVLAIGSPFGLEQTVTAGIISAIRQSLVIEGRSFSNLIQTDAAINRGNSGGPLVNIRGEVVGINTAIYAPTGVFSGIGFAIPVNEAKKILQDLIKKGYVERSWMGVEIGELDEVMAQQFGLKTPEGALVNNIIPDSPADKGGLKRGDVIVEINGKKMKNVVEVQDTVGSVPPKTTITVKAIRDGVPKTLKITTEIMPNQQAGAPSEKEDSKSNTSTGEWLGAMFSDITDRVRDQMGIEDRDLKGIVAVDVPPDCIAAEAGLMEGDVVRSVNRVKTEKISMLKDLSKKLNPKKGLVFDVVRRGRSFYLSYKSLE